jgi:hypothetical protein
MLDSVDLARAFAYCAKTESEHTDPLQSIESAQWKVIHTMMKRKGIYGEFRQFEERDAGSIRMRMIVIIIHLLGLAPAGWLAAPDKRA